MAASLTGLASVHILRDRGFPATPGPRLGQRHGAAGERRRNVRARASLPLVYYRRRGNRWAGPYDAVTIDISAGGIAFRTSHEPPSERLLVIFPLDGEDVAAFLDPVRCEQHEGQHLVAGAFEQLDQPTRLRLCRFVLTQLAEADQRARRIQHYLETV